VSAAAALPELAALHREGVSRSGLPEYAADTGRRAADRLMEKLFHILIIFGALCLALALAAKFFSDMDECHRKHGVLVNTFFGYDCITNR
jgi:hypothetical protein